MEALGISEIQVEWTRIHGVTSQKTADLLFIVTARSLKYLVVCAERFHFILLLSFWEFCVNFVSILLIALCGKVII